MYIFISETVSSSKIQYLYYKVHTFQHFYYIYKLTRECTLRISGENRCPSSIIETDFEPKDVILKIGIVGAFTEENLRFISKIKGELLQNSFMIEYYCLNTHLMYVCFWKGKENHQKIKLYGKWRHSSAFKMIWT